MDHEIAAVAVQLGGGGGTARSRGCICIQYLQRRVVYTTAPRPLRYHSTSDTGWSGREVCTKAYSSIVVTTHLGISWCARSAGVTVFWGSPCARVVVSGRVLQRWGVHVSRVSRVLGRRVPAVPANKFGAGGVELLYLRSSIFRSGDACRFVIACCGVDHECCGLTLSPKNEGWI